MPSKTLTDLVFPVFRLRAHDEIYTNPLGLKMLTTQYKEYVLDDPSQEGTYAIRRIRMKRLGREVYPLRDKYDTFSRMIQQPSGTVFIDSEGGLFKYRKAGKYWRLNYHAIEYVTLIEGGTGMIIKAMNISSPFVFHTILNTSLKYIGVLSKYGMHIPYDLSFKKRPPTVRMI